MQKSITIGFWPTTSFVVGNMIGSGIFLLPATLAFYQLNSLYGWLFSTLGAILLSVVFSFLSKHLSQSEGGPYAYTVAGLGRFPGFLVAWGYWISIWSTNAAIAVALVGYLKVIFPFVGASPIHSIVTGLVFVWLFTWVNSKKLKTVGAIQLITTILKVLPLIGLCTIGLFYCDWGQLSSWFTTSVISFESITAATTLTFFAFLGMESATIPSKGIANSTIIKKATIYGTLFTAVIYILSFIVICSVLPPNILSKSEAPFADSANVIWGMNGQLLFAWCAVISTIGALNGWILIQGKIPYSASIDKLFPSVFGKVNKAHSPIYGLIISSILVSILMALNYSKSLVDAFSFMMKLSTLSVITPYIFSIITFFLMVRRMEVNSKTFANYVVALMALLFCCWMVFGCGFEVVMYGLILLALGIPLYLLIKQK